MNLILYLLPKWDNHPFELEINSNYLQMNKYFLALIALIGITSCNSLSDYDSEILSIDVTPALGSSEIVPLSRIAKSIEYIKLETDTNCLIGKVNYAFKNIRFTDNIIFVTDNSGKILSFDYSGKFITQIGKVGRGPGEYPKLGSFSYLPDTKQIIVNPFETNKLLFYNLNGFFVKEIILEFRPTQIVAHKNLIVLVAPRGRRNYTGYYSLIVLSDEGKEIAKLIYRKNEMEIERSDKIPFGGSGSHIFSFADGLVYHEPFYDSIWYVSDDLSTTKTAHITYNLEKSHKDFYSINTFEQKPTNIVLEEAFKTVILSSVFSESENYMFLELINKGSLNRILVEKQTGESYSVGFIKKDYGIGNFMAFENDIDNGIPFWPDGMKSQNEAFKVIDGYLDFDFRSNRMSDSLKTHPIRVGLQEKPNRDDNPTIMVVTLK
jgi:hypothetical protein